MPIITIPKILQEKLTDAGAHALVEILDKVENRSQTHTMETVELKFERRLTEETTRLEIKIESVRADLEMKIESVRADLEIKIESVKADLEIKIESVRADLEKKIESVRTDLIKWMFIFWIGQFASIVGVLTAILFAFFRK
ncbi:MAG: CCDC90 family protein [Candidatus Brocadiaceae bacterium]|nr:CCDC90 family protein [Candidatus Brocadiaceae bacterium]